MRRAMLDSDEDEESTGSPSGRQPVEGHVRCGGTGDGELVAFRERDMADEKGEVEEETESTFHLAVSQTIDTGVSSE